MHLLLIIPVFIWATACPAQGLIEQFTQPSTQPPLFSPSYSSTFGLPTQSRDGSERISSWRVGAGASVPLFLGRRSRIIFSPGYDYLALKTRRHRLPSQLVSTGASVLASREDDWAHWGGYASYMVKSDLDRFQAGDGQYSLGTFAAFHPWEDWHMIPGLAYISDSAVGFIEGLPFPFLQFVYAPNAEFLAAFGIPFNLLRYSPAPWLSFGLRSFGGILGEVSVSQTFPQDRLPSGISSLGFRQFIGSTGEVFTPTAPRFSENDRIFYRATTLGVAMDFGVAQTPLVIGVGYRYAMAARWIVGWTQTFAVSERMDLNPGHALSITLSASF